MFKNNNCVRQTYHLRTASKLMTATGTFFIVVKNNHPCIFLVVFQYALARGHRWLRQQPFRPFSFMQFSPQLRLLLP